MPRSAFILSSPRTGSTLLRYILDTHCDICSPGELRLGRLCADLLVTLQRTLGQTRDRPDEETGFQELVQRTRNIVDGILHEYCSLRGAHLWCDKAPGNLDHLEILERIYPDANYVCLHRDALDVAHSCLEVSRRGFMEDLALHAAGQPVDLVAAMLESWIDKTTTLLDFERRHPKRCFRIRYESIVQEPVETLRPLFEFLGVDWEPDLLERVFSVPHDRGGGDPKIVFTRRIETSHVGQGSTMLLHRIPERLRDRLESLLEELGYPPLEEDRQSAFADAPEATETDGAQRATSVEDVFTVIVPRSLADNAQALRDVEGTFQFLISGAEKPAWRIDLSASPPAVVEEKGPADLTLQATEEVLLDIVSGELHPFSAYREGLIQLRGAPELSYKLGLFF